MPKLIQNRLTQRRVQTEKRPGYYADGDGLYLFVAKNGVGYYVWRGKVDGFKNRREIGIGPARLVKLANARETARQWRLMAREGLDPKVERDRRKLETVTFRDAATRVHAEQVLPHARNPKHARQWLKTLEDYAYPIVGDCPIRNITTGDVLTILAPIWTEKAETARRVQQRTRTVFDWARTAGLFDGVNPVVGVEKGTPQQRDRVRHRTALPYADLPALMRRIDRAEGMGVQALRFLIFTAALSGEVRHAHWAEIEEDERLWVIPAERMKAGREHRVPLSAPALAVLATVRGLSDGLIFPSRKPGVPLSDMTLSAVLKRLDVPATVHGFRSTFRDWCEETTSFSYEVKEAALAHVVKSATERAYRRTDLFDQRRKLMDAWGTFCTSAGRQGDVVELRR